MEALNDNTSINATSFDMQSHRMTSAWGAPFVQVKFTSSRACFKPVSKRQRARLTWFSAPSLLRVSCFEPFART